MPQPNAPIAFDLVKSRRGRFAPDMTRRRGPCAARRGLAIGLGVVHIYAT